MGSVSTIYNGVRTWLAGRALMDVAFSDRSTNGVQNKVIKAKFDEVESKLTKTSVKRYTEKGVIVDAYKCGNIVNLILGGTATEDIPSNSEILALNGPIAIYGKLDVLVPTTANQRLIVDGIQNSLYFAGAIANGTNIRGSVTYACPNFTPLT